MSTGLVICSACGRELHQDGNKLFENGWRHCEDKTPLCPGAQWIWPETRDQIKGEWCGRDVTEEQSYRLAPQSYKDEFGSGPASPTPSIVSAAPLTWEQIKAIQRRKH